MYDGGNYISVVGKTAEGKAQWEFELPYTQDCEGLFPWLGLGLGLGLG